MISDGNFEPQSKVRSPLFWYGGKGSMLGKLLPMIQYPHGTYVEPFAGGASVFFGKAPMGLEVLNDIERGVVGFYKILQDPTQFPTFYKWVVCTPYSREEYYHCRDTWEQEPEGMLRYYKWFIAKRQSFSGEGRPVTSWSYGRDISVRGMAGKPSAFLSMIDVLPATHLRIRDTVIESLDFAEVILKYDSDDTFFYMDPPYLLETRKTVNYIHELPKERHEELIDLLHNIKGKALVSCYDHTIYRSLLRNGWSTKSWQTSAHAAGRTRMTNIKGKGAASKMQPRIETVYYNW